MNFKLNETNTESKWKRWRFWLRELLSIKFCLYSILIGLGWFLFFVVNPCWVCADQRESRNELQQQRFEHWDEEDWFLYDDYLYFRKLLSGEGYYGNELEIYRERISPYLYIYKPN